MRLQLLLALALGFGAPIPAQCALQALPGDPVAGVHVGLRFDLMWPYVQAITEWDPDGPGPLGTQLVVGGEFGAIADIVANNIAAFDPATGQWSPLGGGSSAPVAALVTLPTGELVASGGFTVAGSTVARIAQWNGTSWSGFGSGLGSSPQALTVLPGGQLVAGGFFGIARWTGTGWANLGAGVNGTVKSLRVLANGDLLVGGQFTLAGGAPASNIARWNGASWSPLGAGLGQFSFRVDALAELPTGELVAGCSTAGGPAVFAWNGATWGPLGSGLAVSVAALELLPDGRLVAAGFFGAPPGAFGTHIATWNGVAWTPISSGTDRGFRCLRVTPSGLLAGGDFTRVDGIRALGLAAWDGSLWRPAVPGTDGAVLAVAAAADVDEEFFAGGDFLQLGGTAVNHVARRRGSAWQSLGGGVDGPVQALLTLPNGDLIVGGRFANAGGAPAACIARWDGATWSPLGSGFQASAGSTSASVRQLARLPNGHLVAAGSFHRAGTTVVANLAVWNGSTWSPLGSGSGGAVNAIAVAGNGDLLATGSWQFGPPPQIARWDGSSWLPTGTGSVVGTVSRLSPLAGGEILATGNFTQIAGTPATGAAIWNGTAWAQAGGGLTDATSNAVVLPDGQALVAGFFAPTSPTNYRAFARWNGTSFQVSFDSEPLGGTALALLRNGDLVLGGAFARAAAQSSASVLVLRSTCPATVTSRPSGCPNAAALVAVERPWVGGNYDWEAAALPAGSFAVGVFGFAAALVPLASLTPVAPPNCDLLVATDATLLYVPAGGRVTGRLVIPAATALVGQVLRQQLVQVQVGPAGSLVGLEATNALTLTLGSL